MAVCEKRKSFAHERTIYGIAKIKKTVHNLNGRYIIITLPDY